MSRHLFVSLAAAASLLAVAAPAHAGAIGPIPDPAPYGAPPRPSGPKVQLTLSYTAESGFASAVKLTCEPAGGGHPDPVAACATLSGVGADPGRIKPAPVACMMIYAPVTAEVTGTWRRMAVTWRKDFGNTCEMRRATGVLFRF